MDAGCLFLMRWYCALESEKPVTMGGRGPIPVSKIWELCDRRGYTGHLADHVEAVIRAIDHAMMRRDAAQQKLKRPSKEPREPKSPKPPARRR